MSFIIYPQADNKLAVIIPAGDVNDCIKDVPEGVQYKIVETLDIDDNYFDAYDFNSEDGAEVNIDKAKAIHLNKFRHARTPLLARLDVDYMKALETNDSVKSIEIAAKKQALRDITLTPLPDTLPEIKATWPEILT